MENRSLGDRIIAAKRHIRSRSIDGVERRFQTTTLETREADDGKWFITGHGIVYNSLSEDLGGFREEIMPGAADGLLSDPDIWGLFNHNPDLPLGRTGAGTMRLADDAPRGVSYEIDGPDTSYGNDLRVSIARGDVTRSSFAFRIARMGEEWVDDEETGLLLRRVHRFSKLYDFSPVTYAAYLATDSGVRTAPNHEREGDEPAEAAHPDGVETERHADNEGLSRDYVARDLAMRQRIADA